MTGLSVEGFKTCRHEAAHAVLCFLLWGRGYLDLVARAVPRCEGPLRGVTMSHPPTDRPNEQVLFEQIVSTLGAVRVEPIGGDGDMRKAWSAARALNPDDPQSVIDAATKRADELIATREFGRGLSALEGALMSRLSIYGHEADTIIKTAIEKAAV